MSRNVCFDVLNRVRQSCLLSLCLCNIIADTLLAFALDEFEDGLSTSGRLMTNLRYANVIVLVDSSEPA